MPSHPIPSASLAVPRHRLSVRVWHWINAVAFMTMLISGFVILLAHPRLYWGEAGYYGDPAWLDMPLRESLSFSGYARSVHFLAAWILVINAALYLLYGLANGHFLRRLLPSAAQLRPIQIARDVWMHLRLKTHVDVGGSYNLLQKLSYLGVLFLLLPLVLLTGLTMSPAVTTDYPWLFDLFGGRQSARSIHFIAASALLLFLLVHVFQVILVGFRREVMAMITGGRTVPPTVSDPVPPTQAGRSPAAEQGE
jgi:Ni/Fe-hydrogenase b-type cytochrome subunit